MEISSVRGAARRPETVGMRRGAEKSGRVCGISLPLSTRRPSVAAASGGLFSVEIPPTLTYLPAAGTAQGAW